MLRGTNTIGFDPDLMASDGNLSYAQVTELGTETESVEPLTPPGDLDYIFDLIRTSFLNIDVISGYFLPEQIEDKKVYRLSFLLLSLPFRDGAKLAEVEQWNDLVELVSRDFNERKESALRGKCSYEKLDAFIRDQIENFEYEDRERLNPEKLTNLIVFVYDYCMLTMREAKLHHNLDMYVKGVVTIREKHFFPPLRVCASVKKYEPYIEDSVDGEAYLFDNYNLPKVKLSSAVQNPHASDSNCSALFVDMLHKFFLSFGLKKRGKSEWSNAEKILIYESLRLFGLCKSSQPAAKSKYVTTVLNEYGDYFASCNLRTWIREDQAYSYLMFCSVESLVRKGQQINEPFLSLESYSVVEEEMSDSESSEEIDDGSKLESSKRVIPHEELPEDIRTALKELSGLKIKVSHTEFDLVKYAFICEKAPDDDIEVEWDPRLEYVKTLIDSAFDYITLFPMLPRVMVVRNDLENPKIQERLASALERDLLGRLDSIPRGFFDSEQAKKIIMGFYRYLPKEDRERFDVDKFYVLFLFIYDYVYLNYQEATISPHLKKFLPSRMEIGDETYSSTVLADDMLMGYLDNLYTFSCSDDRSRYFQQFREPKLYVPAPQDNYPIKHPSCNVKNMTAMFYDMFVRFFQAFGLSKRSDVKYLSDQESILVAELANCCGICVTDKPGTARSIFMGNKDYFEKSALELSIRENEYGYLLLNSMSDVLFGPKPK